MGRLKNFGKVLGNESFQNLKTKGATVPRSKTGYIMPFNVGNDYTVFNEDRSESIKVRCTQDCPHHLIKIN